MTRFEREMLRMNRRQYGHNLAWILGVILLLLAACGALGAPVPTHLMKPSPDPVVPGLVWSCCNYTLKVVRVNGDVVTFDSANHPGATFIGESGLGYNQCRKSTVLKDLRDFSQPGKE